MNKAFGTNFGKKYMTLGEIKKFLASVKQGELHNIPWHFSKPQIR
jgi:hypothetical protein